MQPFPPGWLEFDFTVRVLERDMAVVDNGMLVSHVHSHGVVDNMRGNYHNGRSTTGLASAAERPRGTCLAIDGEILSGQRKFLIRRRKFLVQQDDIVGLCGACLEVDELSLGVRRDTVGVRHISV